MPPSASVRAGEAETGSSRLRGFTAKGGGCPREAPPRSAALAEQEAPGRAGRSPGARAPAADARYQLLHLGCSTLFPGGAGHPPALGKETFQRLSSRSPRCAREMPPPVWITDGPGPASAPHALPRGGIQRQSQRGRSLPRPCPSFLGGHIYTMIDSSVPLTPCPQFWLSPPSSSH